VNPRHLAALSLFLLFALDGTLRMAASPQTAQHFDAKLFQELRWRLIGPSRGGRALAVAGGSFLFRKRGRGHLEDQ
jgi:hypothetical protein